MQIALLDLFNISRCPLLEAGELATTLAVTFEVVFVAAVAATLPGDNVTLTVRLAADITAGRVVGPAVGLAGNSVVCLAANVAAGHAMACHDKYNRTTRGQKRDTFRVGATVSRNVSMRHRTVRRHVMACCDCRNMPQRRPLKLPRTT